MKVALIINPSPSLSLSLSTKHRHPAYPSVMLFSFLVTAVILVIREKDDLENGRTSFLEEKFTKMINNSPNRGGRCIEPAYKDHPTVDRRDEKRKILVEFRPFVDRTIQHVALTTARLKSMTFPEILPIFLEAFCRISRKLWRFCLADFTFPAPQREFSSSGVRETRVTRFQKEEDTGVGGEGFKFFLDNTIRFEVSRNDGSLRIVCCKGEKSRKNVIEWIRYRWVRIGWRKSIFYIIKYKISCMMSVVFLIIILGG